MISQSNKTDMFGTVSSHFAHNSGPLRGSFVSVFRLRFPAAFTASVSYLRFRRKGRRGREGRGEGREAKRERGVKWSASTHRAFGTLCRTHGDVTIRVGHR